jgi:hypothetical protein
MIYAATSRWIAAIPKDGGPPKGLAGGAAETIAVDATHVYWTVAGESATSSGALFRVPKSGGCTDTLLTDLRVTSILAADGRLFAVVQETTDGPADIWAITPSRCGVRCR